MEFALRRIRCWIICRSMRRMVPIPLGRRTEAVVRGKSDFGRPKPSQATPNTMLIKIILILRISLNPHQRLVLGILNSLLCLRHRNVKWRLSECLRWLKVNVDLWHPWTSTPQELFHICGNVWKKVEYFKKNKTNFGLVLIKFWPKFGKKNWRTFRISGIQFFGFRCRIYKKDYSTKIFKNFEKFSEKNLINCEKMLRKYCKILNYISWKIETNFGKFSTTSNFMKTCEVI